MSYVRWGEDGSHVYLIGDEDNKLVCCGCFDHYHPMTHDEAIAHLAEHRGRGDTVPLWLDEELSHERDHLRLTGSGPWHSLRWARARGLAGCSTCAPFCDELNGPDVELVVEPDWLRHLSGGICQATGESDAEFRARVKRLLGIL